MFGDLGCTLLDRWPGVRVFGDLERALLGRWPGVWVFGDLGRALLGRSWRGFGHGKDRGCVFGEWIEFRDA